MPVSTVLAVDDEPLSRRVLASVLGQAGFQVVCAQDGEEAWEHLATDPGRFDAIVLDRRMPRMDGLELLRRIKHTETLAQIPVILQTTLAAHSEVAEGIRAGAYYYIAKPCDGQVLVPIVQAAIRDRMIQRELQRELDHCRHSMALCRSGRFRYRTLEDAWFLANLLSNACPDPARVATGLAELLVNAVEHGNLGIGYHGKSGLTESNTWMAEVKRRLELPENRNKEAEVSFERLQGEIRIVIQDCGEGFDWRRYLELDSARAFDDHGRGIAMARLVSFDRLDYNLRGNIVTAVIETP